MRKKHSRACGRGAERAVVQHALIRLTVGKREEPGPNHANAIDHFPAHQMTKLGAIFRWNYSGGMIRKTRQYRDVMSIPCPMAGKLGGARGRGSHCWRKILRNIENFHRFLVVVELKCALIAERSSAFARVASIVFPPISVMRKNFIDRKSTRLNSSHQIISYAVFCLKKKKKKKKKQKK